MKKMIVALLVSSLLSAVSVVSYANNQLDTELLVYLRAFEGNSFTEMKGALGEMKWKGITDADIYEAMYSQFKKTKLSSNQVAISQTIYLVKGLALSGDDEYKNLIKAELDKKPHNKLIEPYKEALKSFDQYALWNPVISANLEQAGDIHLQRIENMLVSDHAELVATGAKKVSSLYYNDKKFIDLSARRLADIYPEANDTSSVKAATRLCEAISKSGQSQYKKLLKDVAETAKNKKLRKKAEVFVKAMR